MRAEFLKKIDHYVTMLMLKTRTKGTAQPRRDSINPLPVASREPVIALRVILTRTGSAVVPRSFSRSESSIEERLVDKSTNATQILESCRSAAPLDDRRTDPSFALVVAFGSDDGVPVLVTN
jgi:hypothetical protein